MIVTGILTVLLTVLEIVAAIATGRIVIEIKLAIVIESVIRIATEIEQR